MDSDESAPDAQESTPRWNPPFPTIGSPAKFLMDREAIMAVSDEGLLIDSEPTGALVYFCYSDCLPGYICLNRPLGRTKIWIRATYTSETSHSFQYPVRLVLVLLRVQVSRTGVAPGAVLIVSEDSQTEEPLVTIRTSLRGTVKWSCSRGDIGEHVELTAEDATPSGVKHLLVDIGMCILYAQSSPGLFELAILQGTEG